ncbi:MAG: helix-turn-helix domain-containing protein [Bacteroidota bacterium]
MFLILNFIGLIFSCFLGSMLVYKSQRSDPESLLAGLLMLIFGCLILNSIRILGFGPDYHLWYEVLSNHLILLIGPILFLYTFRQINKRRIRLSDGLHAIPFLMLLLGNVVLRLMGEKGESIQGAFDVFAGLFLITSLAVYMGISLRLVIKYHKKHRRLLWTLGGFAFVWGINLLFQGIHYLMPLDHELWTIAATLLLSVLVVVLTYQEWLSLLAHQQKRPQRLLLKEADKEGILLSLEQLMQTSKPYLQPDFSLTKLSEEIGYPSSYISRVINSEHGLGFKKYMARLRVQEFMTLAQEQSNRKFTIMALAREAGFRSSSTFHTAFREHAGQLPSEFMKGL